MQLELNEQQKMIQKMVREFAEKEVAPIAAELDEKEEYPICPFEKEWCWTIYFMIGFFIIIITGSVIMMEKMRKLK